MDSLWLYVVASLALIATPGQDMLYVVSRSLAQGRWAGVCSAAGVCLGILVHTALAALGVAALLQASEAAFLVLKLAGAAYLVYLGIRTMFTAGAAAVVHERTPLPARTLLWQGMVSNVTNPKIVLFFLAFLPQFIDAGSAHPTRDLVFLGVLYAVLAFPVKAGVGIAAGSLSERVLRRPSVMAWVNRASGAVLIGLGLRLAAAER